MASNTEFKPTNINEFNANAQRINIQGVEDIVTPGETKNIDLTLTDDHLLQGVETLLVFNAEPGDKCNLMVVHPLIGTVPEGQFVTNFFINPQSINQEISKPNYTAKLSAGLIIRLQYIAVSSGVDRDIKINWCLHKVLV